jgi:hypothetical protein
VTTALDMESGVYPVDTWYRSREGKAPINFGTSAAHRAAIPGARHEEVFRVFELAAARGATVFVHTRSTGEIEPRSSLEAFQEVLADAAASGAALHIVHITSSGLRQTPLLLSMITG